MGILQLKEMLTYCRPARSNTETEFIDNFIKHNRNAQEDAFGNVYIIVGESDTLFSCHTDTVHSKEGRQEVIDDQVFGIFSKKDGEVLGADDTAGIWIMLNMIDNNIPGVYIFHKDEEIGGLGSAWIAKNKPDYIKGINKAIAFDRRGQDEVITHQFMGRCCSDIFGNALAEEIGVGYRTSPLGIFTDTAQYTSFIIECTNISVGYENEHTPHEYLDYTFLCDILMPKLLKVDYETLPVIIRDMEFGEFYMEDYEDNYYRTLEASYELGV